jgi:hypothetical protein
MKVSVKTLDDSVSLNQMQIWVKFVKPAPLQILSGIPESSHFHPKSLNF